MHDRRILVRGEQVRRRCAAAQREALHFFAEMSARRGELQQFAVCKVGLGLGGNTPDADILIGDVHHPLCVIRDAMADAGTDRDVAHEAALYRALTRRQFPLL